MLTLIGQVQAMCDPERAPDFDAAKWLASWLVAPLPALGGATPASCLNAMEGQRHLSKLVEMTLHGTYA